MKHTTLDAYGAKHYLEDIKGMNDTLTELCQELELDPICPPYLLPYYYGRVKEDVGVSGYVLLEGGHATIHTFPLRECYFVDVFSIKDYNEDDLLDFFKKELPFKMDMSSIITKDRSIKENDIKPYDPESDFGPHLMAEIDSNIIVTMDYLFDLLETMVNEINMDPITRPAIVKSSMKNAKFLSGIIIIAQSHIALHYDIDKNKIFADIFSCAPFDYSVIKDYLEKLGTIVSSSLVARGTKHIYRMQNDSTKEEIEACSRWQKTISK